MQGTVHLFIWKKYNFVRNYKHAHKVYTHDLQMMQGHCCLFSFFLLQSLRLLLLCYFAPEVFFMPRLSTSARSFAALCVLDEASLHINSTFLSIALAEGQLCLPLAMYLKHIYSRQSEVVLRTFDRVGPQQ
jgi:hypothetical protein